MVENCWGRFYFRRNTGYTPTIRVLIVLDGG